MMGSKVMKGLAKVNQGQTVFVADMIDFTVIMSVTKINPTTELALFWRRVTILGFIYIYA